MLVGLRKVVAGKEEWLVEAGGECVGEEVTEVQGRGLPAFARAPEHRSRKLTLILGERDDFDPGAGEQETELAFAMIPVHAWVDDSCFDEGRSTDGVAPERS
jgi:hypothetical protein